LKKGGKDNWEYIVKDVRYLYEFGLGFQDCKSGIREKMEMEIANDLNMGYEKKGQNIAVPIG